MKFVNLKDILVSDIKDQLYEVRDKNEVAIAYLSMITEEDLEDDVIVGKITSWREKYINCFLSNFQPTVQRTYIWMKDILIPDNNRVLFKILTIENRFVGHVGAIKRNSFIEYDYYIKGENVDVQDFSLIVAKRFLYWVCERTGINIVKGNVRSDNKRAMDFHLRTGFRINRQFPVYKKYSSGHEYSLVICDNNHNPEPDLFLNEILLLKEDIKV